MNTHFQTVRQPVFLTTLSAVLVVSLLMGALSLVPGLPSTAQASGEDGDKKITLCHATGTSYHPYVEITVSFQVGSGHGHEGHADDIIPAPSGGCPGTNNPPPTAESTSTVPPTATQAPPTPTATATLTPTETSTLQLLPTLTGTPLSEATHTPLPPPTNTPLSEATHTPLPPPTNTPLPQATNTSLPLPTNTLLPRVTNTPLPSPTNTVASRPTNTKTPSPTATSTRTNTPVATATSTSTLPPTPTRTASASPMPTATPKPGCYVFGSSDVPKAIPDGNAAGVNSVLTLPSPGLVLTSAGVRVDRIAHTYDSDLQISLIAPNGLAILVADQVGGDGDNFLGTILDDAGLLPIVNGDAPFTGAFQPDNPLFQVTNLNSAGTWRLHVVDMSVGDAGSLNAWALEVCGRPATSSADKSKPHLSPPR